jgi:hypothetical protein
MGVDNLGSVSQLFTNYLNGVNSPVIARGKSTLQSDGSTISWLSTGIQSLALTVPFKPLAPINPIQSITLGDLDLAFDATAPWTPLSNSKTVQATLREFYRYSSISTAIYGHHFSKSCRLASIYPSAKFKMISRSSHLTEVQSRVLAR